MEDTELDIILSAVDNASDTFESVQSAAEGMGDSIENVASEGNAGLGNLQESAEEVASGLGDVQGSAEDAGYSMEQLLDYCNNMYAGKIEELANETERSKEESDEAGDSFSNLSNILSGIAGAEIFNKLADALWSFADKAGTFEDSMMRARLEAEGAGISVNDMTDAVSELSSTTGRAGGEIRESFIKATARGITDLDSFKKMMEGAGAQATLLGTDIGSLADRYSGFASRSRIMEKALANTGITIEELGEALGIQGATIDDVNAKWETMTEDQRAAALGMAASMNEGKTANEEYKKSWAGLQAQLDIAKGRLERLAGEVLLPVLIPALEVAGRVLNWLGDTISAVMDGPLGGLISVVGASAAAFALAVPAYMAVSAAYDFITGSAVAAAAAELLALWPILLIAAAVAALTYVVYEVGKAFGWWTDVSTMIDAIWAGIQRLWSAFINHPDVQGFIQGVSDAWKAMQPFLNTTISLILRFFNVSGKKDFDIVRTLIDTISKAWAAMTLPIKTVIEVIKTLWNAFSTMYQKCKTALDNAKKAFDKFKEKVQNIVRDVIKEVSKITGIDISGVVSKIVKPFKDAYDGVAKQVEKIKKKAKEIPSNVGRGGLGVLGGFSGGEDLEFYGGSDLTSYSTEKLSVDMNQNINLSLDLRNVPPSMDERQLAGLINETLDSKEFINRLVNNPDFQSLDSKVKQRIVLKSNRANGRGV